MGKNGCLYATRNIKDMHSSPILTGSCNPNKAKNCQIIPEAERIQNSRHNAKQCQIRVPQFLHFLDPT